MAKQPDINIEVRIGEQPGLDWSKTGEITYNVWTREAPTLEYNITVGSSERAFAEATRRERGQGTR